MRQKTKGFALTEVLLSIAVIAFIGIGAYALYRNSRISAQVEQTANDIALIQKGVQVFFEGQTNYSEVKGQVLDQAGIIPDDMKQSSTAAWTWLNLWGGEVQVAPLENDVGIYKADSLFTITLSNVPSYACTQLVNRVLPAFTLIGSGLYDGDTQNAEIKGLTSQDYNIDLNELATVCNGTDGMLILAFSSN